VGGRNHAFDSAFNFAVLHVGQDLKKAKQVKKLATKTDKKLHEPHAGAAAAASVPAASGVPPPSKQDRKKAGWGSPVKLTMFGSSPSDGDATAATPSSSPAKHHDEGKRNNEKELPKQKANVNAAAATDDDDGSGTAGVSEWDERKVGEWLSSVAAECGLKAKTIKCLVDEDVDGKALLELSQEDLRSIGVSLGQSKAVMKAIQKHAS